MSNESLLNSWTKLCLREKNLPVCLVSISDDGSPHVYTMLDKETTAEIFKHLSGEGGVIGTNIYLNDNDLTRITEN